MYCLCTRCIIINSVQVRSEFGKFAYTAICMHKCTLWSDNTCVFTHFHSVKNANTQLIWSSDRGFLLQFFFIPRLTTLKPQGRNLKCKIFIRHFFKIVLYWCLDLIRHNIGTPLKHNKYISDIPIPFCHHLYLSATFKQCFTEFAGNITSFYVVYMWKPDQIPTWIDISFHLDTLSWFWANQSLFLLLTGMCLALKP